MKNQRIGLNLKNTNDLQKSGMQEHIAATFENRGLMGMKELCVPTKAHCGVRVIGGMCIHRISQASRYFQSTPVHEVIEEGVLTTWWTCG